ncbi:amidase family protein [Marinobacterium lutimaris]|uniref:Aspartyl-tRNA(Asn)/glutamyl-tRNA(Gln) amidotransferase subunit A n=1 Tax=Marinobacterium lutimaris TaxID=568106 RepID=A0A1H6DHF4_9GAMM|nr:amidase family protein [Marinobacterium lutimaris]SEG84223.1 aspartyl-tRNA(Asn)/glutamyl-tRNA(Gln) amidotransferase subunit A [Marinobacterium lutimaris]
MSNPTLTALEMGEQIAAGRLDPIALTREALAKALEAEGVFISLCPERALAEAQAAADRARLKLRRGPLDGVPLAWKDLFDLAGTVTTAGSRVLSNQPAETDARAAYNAAAAGLVSVGKTNLTELAYSGLGLNPHYGTPVSIASGDTPRVPGGSSSGSALAVAQGVVPAAIGTDTAGSLRVPAAFNGLVSYRPSQNRHTREGVTPLADTLDTIGVMAHTLADCVAVDDAMRGETYRPRKPLAQNAVRFVVDMALPERIDIEPAVWRNLMQTVDKLRAAGYSVEERAVAPVHEALDCIEALGWLGAVEAYAEYGHLVNSDLGEQMDPRVRQRLGGAASVSGERLLVLYRERNRMIHSLKEDLDGAVLLTPTVAHVAPELEPLAKDPELFAATNLKTLKLSMVASLLDCPAVALPSGIDADNQFTGLQLSAPCGEDEWLLRSATAVEALIVDAR